MIREAKYNWHGNVKNEEFKDYTGNIKEIRAQSLPGTRKI